MVNLGLPVLATPEQLWLSHLCLLKEKWIYSSHELHLRYEQMHLFHRQAALAHLGRQDFQL
jgi:hypothetical protein